MGRRGGVGSAQARAKRLGSAADLGRDGDLPKGAEPIAASAKKVPAEKKAPNKDRSSPAAESATAKKAPASNAAAKKAAAKKVAAADTAPPSAPVAKKAAAKKAAKKVAPKPQSQSGGGTVRAARGNSSLAKVQQSIEAMLDLPTGSVQITAPRGKKIEDTSSVAQLRAIWAEAATTTAAKTVAKSPARKAR